MKFGTFLYQTSPNSIAAVARKAEESGFESLWIPEHIILPVTYRSPYPYSSTGRMGAPPETPLHDPLLALAYVAGVTTKIRLATGVFVLPIRNAFTTAKAVASLDVLSGGRFIFGVGIGWLEEEFEGVGMNFKDRALRTREYIALMKELWTSDAPEYHGKTISVEGFKFMPKPAATPNPRSSARRNSATAGTESPRATTRSRRPSSVCGSTSARRSGRCRWKLR
jgi:probable F420-dependent oxidoreductase